MWRPATCGGRSCHGTRLQAREWGFLSEAPLTRACLACDDDDLGGLSVALELARLGQGLRDAERPNGADINLQQLVGIVHVSLTADAHGLDRAAEVRRAIDQNVKPLREIIDELLHGLASDTASSASAEPRPAWIA